MLASLMNRISIIEALKSHPSTDAEVLELMEKVALAPEGLAMLVEKYSSSLNPIIVRTLSFVIATKSLSIDFEIYPFIFSFIERLRYKDDESTLINCLTAIQRQLMLGFTWSSNLRLSSVLYPFLMHCLDQSVLVQRGVIAVLSGLYKGGLIHVFDKSQTNSLRNRLRQLSTQKNEMLSSDLDELKEFFNDAENH